MRLVISERFWRNYDKLTPVVQAQVDKALELLKTDPHHPSLRTHKRKDDRTTWQARVSLYYRILFEMTGDTITLIKVIAHEK